MNRNDLIHQIRTKKSFLCVGLDPDLEKLPIHIPKTAEGMKQFCIGIIDATKDSCVSYKLNAAFFEALGWEGYKVMQEIIAYIPETHFTIADAKRGDIGNTSKQYAKAFFETMGADGLTISPYMGSDSIQPFLEFENKWAIILGLTSNIGSKDFELLKINEDALYEVVLKSCSQWGNIHNMMFVIGATQPAFMQSIRKLLPQHFFLVPGVGAQGGSLEDVCRNLISDEIGILVNSSREIIFASSGEDYAAKAGEKARETCERMKIYI